MQRNITLGLVMLMTGCSSVPSKTSVSETEMQALQGAVLHVNQSEASEFLMQTDAQAVAGAMFGAIGGLVSAGIAIENGNTALKAAAIEDPAKSIEKSVASKLAKYKPGESQPYSSSTPKDGFDLDAKTLGWGTQSFPNGYGILYSAAIKLTDVKSGKVFMQGGCEYKTDPTNAVLYTKFTENNGAWLKNEMEKVVEYCVKTAI